MTKEATKLILTGHTVIANISLEDLKTLTLSVQALWMFTPGSRSRVSPIISFPFLVVTSELFYSAQTSDTVIFSYLEMTLYRVDISAISRKQNL